QDDEQLARSVVDALHPSEIADIIEGLPKQQRSQVWQLLDPEIEGDVLSHTQDAVRAELMEQMQPHEVVIATQDLDTDDVADILQDLPEDVAETILSAMDEQNRHRLASIMTYPEDSAGGLMNLDVISVRTDVTLDVVARYLRRIGEIPEDTDNIMVVDRDNQYLGVLHLTDLLVKDETTTVAEWLDESPCLNAKVATTEVAKLFEQRDLVSAAVVDDQGHLLGRVTIDDVVDVIQDAADQTVRSMAGLSSEDDMFASVITSTRRRAIWLGINLLTVFLGVWVIGRFEDTIQQLVALAILLPVVAGMGGIAGSQTLTIAIRGIAQGQLVKTNVKPLLYKELAVGTLNGLVWSCIVGLVVLLWFNDQSLGLIIGMAMLINLIVAAFAGAVIPFILKSFGIDPAIAGSVVLTTVTDVIGFMTFLGLATLFLM
ncbi:MAG: magnesium transporter, partial [Pseudomonadota bacterium]